MVNLSVTEIKAFVPAKDFQLSKKYYQEIGFTMASEGGGVAYFYRDHSSFLLYDNCESEPPSQLVMHLLVEDVEAWWQHIQDSDVVSIYGVEVSDIILQPWRMRDFTISDPSGVVWRIGQNVN